MVMVDGASRLCPRALLGLHGGVDHPTSCRAHLLAMAGDCDGARQLREAARRPSASPSPATSSPAPRMELIGAETRESSQPSIGSIPEVPVCRAPVPVVPRRGQDPGKVSGTSSARRPGVVAQVPPSVVAGSGHVSAQAGRLGGLLGRQGCRRACGEVVRSRVGNAVARPRSCTMRASPFGVKPTASSSCAARPVGPREAKRTRQVALRTAQAVRLGDIARRAVPRRAGRHRDDGGLAALAEGPQHAR